MTRGLALVTGASSGIGWEIAKLLAADSYDLALVARGKKLPSLARELEAGFSVRASVVAADLSRPDAATRVLAEVGKLGAPLDVLVNCAGLGTHGKFAESDLARELESIAVNVTALTALTKGVLPAMVERRSGRILNVASTAAFQPGPLMAVYYATKAYVLSFSEAIANELDGTGVTVTTLCPGPTETEFQKRAGVENTALFRGPLVMDARAVAQAGYAGMQKGRRLVIPGAMNRVMATAVRFAPRRMVTALARRIQETRG
jgi:short-subunit dehydrogenase